MALALWMNKRYQDALEVLQRPGVEEACGHMAYFYTLVGMVARKVRGKHQLACQAYSRALQIEPDRHDTLYNLANLIKEDQPEDADRLYRRSLAINPNSSATWHNFGANLNSLNRHQEAIYPLKTSLLIDALNPEVWCNLGLAYYGAEDFVRAERSFRPSIALDSKHSPGYQNLGNTLINTLRAEEAIEILEKGLELDSSSTHSLWNLSLAYHRRHPVLRFRVLMKPPILRKRWLFGVSREWEMLSSFAGISTCLKQPLSLLSFLPALLGFLGAGMDRLW